MRKAIVGIGGGRVRTNANLAIHREILRLSGKKHPRLLFIPTASSDSETYWRQAQEHFGDLLKCRVDVLWLMREKPAPEAIREKILRADVIYVGGGNTLLMMRLWRRWGVDRLLKKAYKRGTVLSGVSAGAICWFESGHSDSMSFSNPRKWKYIRVKGMGLVPGSFCPHYNSGTRGFPRKLDFQRMIGKMGGIGIGVENNCAIEILGNQFRIFRSRDRARAFKVYRGRGHVIVERIPQQEEFAPLHSLFA
jgi:dipeptidase E